MSKCVRDLAGSFFAAKLHDRPCRSTCFYILSIHLFSYSSSCSCSSSSTLSLLLLLLPSLPLFILFLLLAFFFLRWLVDTCGIFAAAENNNGGVGITPSSSSRSFGDARPSLERWPKWRNRRGSTWSYFVLFVTDSFVGVSSAPQLHGTLKNKNIRSSFFFSSYYHVLISISRFLLATCYIAPNRVGKRPGWVSSSASPTRVAASRTPLLLG